MTRRTIAASQTTPESYTRYLYYWLLFVIFLEYARPASHFPVMDIPFLYSFMPLSLFVASAFAPGLRSHKEIFSDALAKWIFILVGVVFLSIAVAPAKQSAFTVFQGVLGYAILFLLITRIATTVQRLRGVIFALLAAHIFLLAVNPNVVLDPSTRHYILGATFLGDGNDFALSACILFPLVIEFAQSRRTLVTKVVGWGSAILIVLAIIGTQSRGGTLGLAAVLGYGWLQSSRKTLVLAGVAAVVAAILVVAPPQYFQRMGTIKTYQDDGSAQGRIQAWKGGLGMGLKNPVLGIGAGQFGSRWGKTAHSSYVLAFAELGVPGLICALMLVFGNLRANTKLQRRLRLVPVAPGENGSRTGVNMSFATSAAMVGFAVAGAFLSATYYPHLFVLTALMVSTRTIVAQQSSSNDVGVVARRSALRPRLRVDRSRVRASGRA